MKYLILLASPYAVVADFSGTSILVPPSASQCIVYPPSMVLVTHPSLRGDLIALCLKGRCSQLGSASSPRRPATGQEDTALTCAMGGLGWTSGISYSQKG